MSISAYARRELKAAGFFSPDSDYGGMLGNAVMELMEVFEKQGHSGASASRVVAIFSKVASYLPLKPLTGEDSEWVEIGTQDGERLFQNNRCSHVFKCGDRAYDIEGKVFREPSGACFTNHESRVDVTFPYQPTTVFVDVPTQDRFLP